MLIFYWRFVMLENIKKEYLSPREVAQVLSVSRRTIYSWISQGKMPSVKVGSQVRISRTVLETMLLPPLSPPQTASTVST
jgi:excisionase family DNA binding protein